MSERPIKQLFNVYSTLMNPKTPSSVVPETKVNGQQPTTRSAPFSTQATNKQENVSSVPNATANHKPPSEIKKIVNPSRINSKAVKRKKEKDVGKGIKKTRRFQWSDALHRRFMACIFDIGLRQAKPKMLLENLKDASTGLTTEHIKSHLQKYRSNSKKTRELFLSQFEIARHDAIQNHEGKAINPGFHAYPMPIGNYPLPPLEQFNQSESTEQSSGYNGNTVGLGVKSLSSNGNFTDKLAPDNYTAATPKHAPPRPPQTAPTHHIEQPQPKKGSLEQTGSEMFDALSAWSPSPLLETDVTQHQLDLSKQMEEQMEMHKKIQMQHQFQHRRDLGESSGTAPRSGSFDLLEDEIQQLFKPERTTNPIGDGYFVDDNPLHDNEDLFRFLQE